MYKTPFSTKDEIIKTLKKAGFYKGKIKLAINQAIKSHTGQKRDNGNPYLEEHIYPIINSVLSKYKNKPFLKDLLLTCILHDVIEDDKNISTKKLANIFGNKIVSYVLYLTKTPAQNVHRLPQEQKAKINKKILEKLKSAPPIVQIIKLEDRLNNISCIKAIDNKPKYIRYVKETKE